MAVIPFGDDHYYSIEARKDVNNDRTPDAQTGLVIYHYSPTGHPENSYESYSPETIVDTTGTGDLWNADLDVGDKYHDEANRIHITYVSESDTFISVRVIRGSLAVTGPTAVPAGQVVEASGSNRFAVWSDYTPGNYDIFFRRSTDNGATWKPIVNLSTNPGASDHPRIAVSGSNVYVAWRQANADEFDAILGDVFFRRSTDNGATWGPKTKISSSGTVLEAPSIEASLNGVYITWTDSAIDPDCGHCTNTGPLQFRRSVDNGNTWKAVKTLGTSDTFEHELRARGSNIYLVWSCCEPNYDVGVDYNDAFVYFIRSTDGGATWKSPVTLENKVNSQQCILDCKIYDVTYAPQMAVWGSNVYGAWTVSTISPNSLNQIGSNSAFIRSSDGGATWKAIDSNVGYAGDLVASGSNVFAIWNDNSLGNDEILFRRSIDNGATWKPIINISQQNAGKSYDPQIVVSESDALIAWSDNTPGNYDILSRRSIDSGGTWQWIVNLSNNVGDSVLDR